MVMLAMKDELRLLVSALLCLASVVISETDPNDYAVVDAFRKGMENPELLKWPSDDEDPCGSRWPHIFCDGSRVSQIQVANLGLEGHLPENLNQLSALFNVGLQKNNFAGKLPSFRGLSKLQFAYLGSNQFDSIPSDFFVGLDSLQALSLDKNPLNQSTGWMLPDDLAGSAQLSNLSLIQCNLFGTLPVFLGQMSSLTNLKLSYNRLTGEIPTGFSNLGLQILWLNNQEGPGLTGPIDAVASIPTLTDVWLHGNGFNGIIPSGITACTSLARLWLNNNQLVGPVPPNFTSMPQLQSLQLDNNKLIGPIPKLLITNYSYSHNSFCQLSPGVPCPPEVTALLDFLGGMNYPLDLAASWSGNDPCSGTWMGVSCLDKKVSVINLQNRQLNGSISPSIGKLDSLMDIRLQGNFLSGTIPSNLTSLKSLRILNLTGNNLLPPVPKFSSSVKLLIADNPRLNGSPAPSPDNGSPSGTSPSSGGPVNLPGRPNSPPNYGSSPGSENSQNNNSSSGSEKNSKPSSKSSKMSKVLIIVAPIIVGLLVLSLVVLFVLCQRREKNGEHVIAHSIVIHPKEPSDPENMVKIVVAENANRSTTASEVHSVISNGPSETHVIESGNLVISVQTLRNVTQNFCPQNELGRGGFGVVYKGVFDDGSMIAVKRMEAAVISTKALDEFQSEIAVLSKVRHRNLVSLLGYSVEGNERLLVYEYMSQGALSKHLFLWQKLNLEPLSWKKRLNIALDVARGMEYLHNLAHQSFIHRDMKSSNILLDDDYRAKVSDFGLVKLAPDGKNSVVTRLAGTFGYLAPEYAVTGKITTKADVFSFGVVLMELVTGLTALDENRPEETQYLASWFFHVKSSKEKLKAAIDPSMDVTEETFGSISIIAELAGHCAAREPQQRPDMGHAVNVLAPLVENWKPMKDNQEEYLGIDLSQPLLQMVKGWQAADGSTVSSVSLDDSKGSIPARPAGFAESFTSTDGR
uniref:non-specific serine/threonine protein kinase n=1 Tax=Anthurium amnicola TaxID=1678845 RepID=A0A1D1XCQ6_9ARAE